MAKGHKTAHIIDIGTGCIFGRGCELHKTAATVFIRASL